MESAVKLARQYFIERDGMHTSKALVIARWNSYHGSTIGTMALGQHPQAPYLFPSFKEFPKIVAHYCYRCPFDKNTPGAALPALISSRISLKTSDRNTFRPS